MSSYDAEVFDRSLLKTCEEAIVDTGHEGRGKSVIAQKTRESRRQFTSLVGVCSLDRPDADVNTEVSAKPKQPFFFGLTHLIGCGLAVMPTRLNHGIRDPVVDKTGPEIRIKPDDPRVVPVLIPKLIFKVNKKSLVMRRDDQLKVG